MDLLSVRDGRIVNGAGKELRWRGTCVGGWMNLENFINGYPGSEQGVRATMAEVIGEAKARFFFDRLLDHFLTDDDLAFMKACGATVVRLPFNYRHFEDDLAPGVWREAGFRRLDAMLAGCERHGLYAILDHHAVPGCQNTDWHCDNATQSSLFWGHRHFQDRFVALWEEFARRYRGRAVVAGYNVMNEPFVNRPRGRLPWAYRHAWDRINDVYRRVVGAIRAIDPDHIIILEGDCYSTAFAGLTAPFAPNLVYSSHNYNGMGFGPGAYPDATRGWNRAEQTRHFLRNEGTAFVRQHRVPLWVGEFGAVFNGEPAEFPDRLRALDDQIDVFEEHGAHWTTWTWKDVGVMGWVTLDPDCEYLRRVAPILAAKRELRCDQWQGWLPRTTTSDLLTALAGHLTATIPDRLDAGQVEGILGMGALAGFAAECLQRAYCQCFADCSEADLDRILSAFAFPRCRPNTGLLTVLRRHLAR
jgi:hypothetical protein